MEGLDGFFSSLVLLMPPPAIARAQARVPTSATQQLDQQEKLRVQPVGKMLFIIGPLKFSACARLVFGTCK